uniref:Uncharacterized protein n=1 Tax=Plectus sambesii TaxID=2011161 RepID=A0A914V998_9BILA
MRSSSRSYNKLPSGYMFYYASDDTKTTAGTGFYIPASTNYDISDDNDHDGISDESDSGVGNKTTASMSTSPHR